MARCRKCGKKSDIYLRSYNLALCKSCFLDFFRKRLYTTIEQFKICTPKDNILIAVSGGKDSLALWHVLEHLGYTTRGLHIDLGLGRNSEEAKETIVDFSQKFQLDLKIVKLKEIFGFGLSQISRIAKRVPCSVCGLIKRYIMNKEAYDFDCIATGHHLDDEASTLLGNVLNWQDGFLSRQSPVLEENKTLKRKIKPFCLTSELEISLYIKALNIKHLEGSCPLSKRATSHIYKDVINRIEEAMPATKIRFYKEFIKRRYFKDNHTQDLKPCKVCGYLTVAEICSFCRLKEKIHLYKCNKDLKKVELKAV